MAKEWVLHTETKGTGAQMVPLESVTTRSGATQPVFVPRQPVQRTEPEAKPRAPKTLMIRMAARKTEIQTAGESSSQHQDSSSSSSSLFYFRGPTYRH